MTYLDKVQLLVTSSTDKTMRIWRVDKARALLMYPWFVEFQKVTDLVSVPQSIDSLEVWITCFDTKSSE